MLRAELRFWLSSKYRIFEGDAPVAVLEADRMREAARLILEEATYTMCREGVVFGRFVLEHEDGSMLATAEKPSVFARKFVVEHDGSTYVLRAASILRRRFVLTEGESEIGVIRPARRLSRSTLADLPEDLPVSVRIFLLWLVLLIWKREAASSG